jgi:hypothetical protein
LRLEKTPHGTTVGTPVGVASKDSSNCEKLFRC